jgi:hypothetical protein
MGISLSVWVSSLIIPMMHAWINIVSGCLSCCPLYLQTSSKMATWSTCMPTRMLRARKFILSYTTFTSLDTMLDIVARSTLVIASLFSKRHMATLKWVYGERRAFDIKYATPLHLIPAFFEPTMYRRVDANARDLSWPFSRLKALLFRPRMPRITRPSSTVLHYTLLSKYCLM